MKRTPLKRKPYSLKRTPLRAKRRTIRKVSPRRKENLEVALWAAFSLYIRERDKWVCFTCGNHHPRGSGMMQAGHYHPQGSYKNIMYDPMGVHAQCVSCNKWRHGNLAVYAEKLIDRYGLSAFQALCNRSRMSRQWSRQDRQKLLDILRTNPEEYEIEYYKVFAGL